MSTYEKLFISTYIIVSFLGYWFGNSEHGNVRNAYMYAILTIFMITEEVVKIGRRGQITLPSSVRQAEGFKEGDFLEIADVGGVLTLRKIEKRPNVLDLFKDVGRALQQQGVTTREDAIALIEDIKTHAARPRH